MNKLILKSSAKTAILRSAAHFALTYICVSALAIYWARPPHQIDFMSASIFKALTWSLYVSVTATVTAALFELPKIVPEKFATLIAEMAIILLSITNILVVSYTWGSLLPSSSGSMATIVTLITILTASGIQVRLSLMRGHLSHRKDLNLWR